MTLSDFLLFTRNLVVLKSLGSPNLIEHLRYNGICMMKVRVLLLFFCSSQAYILFIWLALQASAAS